MVRARILSALLTFFEPQPDPACVPKTFPSPFAVVPHALAIRAAESVRENLQNASPNGHDFFKAGQGKMIGVLVVRNTHGEIGFLRSVSGMVGRSWQVPKFVPPLFDLAAREAFWPAGQLALDVLGKKEAELRAGPMAEVTRALSDLKKKHRRATEQLANEHTLRKQTRATLRKALKAGTPCDTTLPSLSNQSQQDRREGKRLRAAQRVEQEKLSQHKNQLDTQRLAIKHERTAVSNGLLQKIQSGYHFVSVDGERRSLPSFFTPEIPPGGSGDCAAPKLLGYANQNALQPLALAEFWWGASPKGSIRHHEYFYPPCQRRCQPILPFLLQGLELQPAPIYGNEDIQENEPTTIHEDNVLLVVHKPAGLLSVPGKSPLLHDSVFTRLQSRMQASVWLVHRLDLDTSGLLLVAKTLDVYKALQRQFSERTVQKQYIAWLDGILPPAGDTTPAHGSIDLPLRVDIDDRPRQIVDFQHGKNSLTHYQVLETRDTFTKVAFAPHTGRTHQLRVHASHPQGLAAPIVGDRLYGRPGGRLRLHARTLAFVHPVSGKSVEVQCPPPHGFDDDLH